VFIRYTDFITIPIGCGHDGLYHLLVFHHIAQHLLENQSYGITPTEVFFLPVGILAILSNPNHQILIGFNDSTPNISNFYENFNSKVLQQPLCVYTGPKTSRESDAWIVMCFLNKGPTLDAETLLKEITKWHVNLPGDIYAICGLTVLARDLHHCDNHQDIRYLQDIKR
jgi:hypothetical protein